MLTTLVIKDFAIISELELGFDAGMSVLTGETGAGKSIIVSALSFLLGGKASPDLVRTGAEEACVEGMFTVDRRHAPTMAMLQSIGIDLDDDEFVVRRTIPRKGRGRIFIGGTLQNLSSLRNLMRTVIDISGQHEHVSLLDSGRHLSILDRYAGLEEEVASFSKVYGSYHALKRERDALAASLEERAKRLDFLNYQIEELRGAGIRVGESEEVSTRLKRLSNTETTHEAIEGAIVDLYDANDSVVSRLGHHVRELGRVSSVESSLYPVVSSLSESMHAVEDAVHDLRHIRLDEASPSQLAALQERLSVIDKLERKYRTKADEIPGLCQSLEAEREALVLSDARITSLDTTLSELADELRTRSEVLSERRRKSSEQLSREVTEGLHLLAMENASIDIVCRRLDDFSELKPTGRDEVEFLLCPNRGESPRALSKIASGGELSRVLLALKRAIVEKDDVACYVFDEVDTGIGGQTAAHVARMLKEVSRCHQVLCITHLASIASFADAHFQVSKFVANERTQSRITLLKESERVQEIARMLGGTSITETTLAHAAEMISQAHEQSSEESF